MTQGILPFVQPARSLKPNAPAVSTPNPTALACRISSLYSGGGLSFQWRRSHVYACCLRRSATLFHAPWRGHGGSDALQVRKLREGLRHSRSLVHHFHVYRLSHPIRWTRCRRVDWSKHSSLDRVYGHRVSDWSLASSSSPKKELGPGPRAKLSTRPSSLYN